MGRRSWWDRNDRTNSAAARELVGDPKQIGLSYEGSWALDYERVRYVLSSAERNAQWKLASESFRRLTLVDRCRDQDANIVYERAATIPQEPGQPAFVTFSDTGVASIMANGRLAQVQ